jgi:hypothetical protein
MTPSQEHTLYLTDPEAWAQHVAPRWLRILRESTEAERKRMWALARPVLRHAIKRLAADEKVAA